MGINIPLLDGYRILSDKYQYILVKEEGDRLKNVSYHSDIQDCVQSFVELKIRGFDANSIQTLIQCIKSFQTRLNKALHPLKLQVEPLKEQGGKKNG